MERGACGVTDGRVTLSGTVERKSMVPVVVRLCESVDGVVDVIDRLGFDRDDTVAGTAPSTGREATCTCFRYLRICTLVPEVLHPWAPEPVGCRMPTAAAPAFRGAEGARP